MFKSYESKPITRRAHKITEKDKINKVAGVESAYNLHSTDQLPFTFKAYEEVKVGDYIVYLTANDTYHCSAAVFTERNIIPKGE